MNNEDMSDVFEKLNSIAGQNNISPGNNLSFKSIKLLYTELCYVMLGNVLVTLDISLIFISFPPALE